MRLTIKLLLVLALVVIAYLVFRPASIGVGDHLFKHVKVDDIALMQFSSGSSTALVQRAGESWVVSSLFEFPAHQARVTGFMDKMENAMVTELADEILHREIQVDVSLLDRDGHVLTAFSLGDMVESGNGGQMIQLQDGSLLVVDLFFDEASPAPVDWIHRQLLDLPPGSVQQVSIVGLKAEYTIQRISDKFRIAGKPEDVQIHQGLAGRMFGICEQLTFETVVDPSSENVEIGLSEHELVMIQTTDGFVHELQVGRPVEGQEGRVVRTMVHYQGVPEPTRLQARIQVDRELADSVQPVEDGLARESLYEKKYQEMLQTHAERHQSNLNKAREINESRSQWRFVVPSSALEQMMPLPEQLVSD